MLKKKCILKFVVLSRLGRVLRMEVAFLAGWITNLVSLAVLIKLLFSSVKESKSDSSHEPRISEPFRTKMYL